MDKGNFEAEQPLARSLVDQVRTRTRELRKRGVQVAHLERNVVHARAALGEEAADRGIGAKRLEQFNATVTDAERRRADTLLFDCRAVLDLRAEEALVRRECGVEVVDRHAEMVDPPRLHPGEATERAS